MQELTSEQVDELVRRYMDEGARSLEDYAVEVGPISDAEVADYAAALRDAIAEDTRRLAQHETDIMQGAAETLLTAAKLKAEQTSPEYRRLLYRLLSASVTLSKRHLEALQPEPPPAVASPAATPRISEVCREFIETNRVSQRWSAKTIASRTQAVALLVDFLADARIGEVTKQTMTDCYLLLPKVPTHYTRRYPGKTPREAIEAADAAGDTDRYSPKSCNLRLETWKAVFKHATSHDQIPKSPAEHLKAFAEGHAQDARDAFSDHQLSAFFARLAAEKARSPTHYWVSRVMAYSGLRLEEASALRPCDVREIDGVLCFEVSPEASRIKTKNAARFVPVHSALRPELESYLRAYKGDAKNNLWGLEQNAAGKWSAALSKRLNDRLSKAVPEKSDRLVVESLRNTFATRLKAADVQEHVISELLGHAVSSLAVGRYGKKLEPSRLTASVERLTLPL
jgi:integrase